MVSRCTGCVDAKFLVGMPDIRAVLLYQGREYGEVSLQVHDGYNNPFPYY